jgi:hypothetical protein
MHCNKLRQIKFKMKIEFKLQLTIKLNHFNHKIEKMNHNYQMISKPNN